ncbi:MAG: sigma-54 dependent transcriptional regulator [Bacteroidota bacterium]
MADLEGKILIVDDDEDILLSLRYLLARQYAKVQTETNPNLIPRLLRNEDFNVVLLDMNFRKGDTSGREGLRWLQKIKELKPTLSVIIITAHGEIEMAVEAVKRGAVDFVVKPWRNEKLMATVLSAYKLNVSKKKVTRLENSQQLINQDATESVIGESRVMQDIFATIKKVAQTDATILLLGENGTGKELIARQLHLESKRNNQPFVSVDLGAIPDTLFESELFGHKKGAFTHAIEDRMGRFEAASGGTLFLDEIGNLSLPLQAKLLAALQNRQITRLGGTEVIKIDIRLVCATNRPLYQMVNESKFRQDLLYRINTVEVTLPPLKERGADVVLLAQHFLKIYRKKYLKPSLEMQVATLDKLQGYHWPGNIRELQHATERAVILSDGPSITPDDFPFNSSRQEASESESQFDQYNLAEIERWTIQKALNKYQGNISKAAAELGITRAALYRRMEKHNL